MEPPAQVKPEPHDIAVVEVKGFAQAQCSCGWHGGGFRSRASAREQALKHSTEAKLPSTDT